MKSGIPRSDSLEQLNKQLDFEPLSYTILYYMQRLVIKLGLPCTRSETCKHRGSCIASMLFNSFKTGVTAYGIKFLLNLAFSLKKILTAQNKLTKLFEIFKDKSTINFALFIASFVAVFRSLVCGLRRKIDKRYDRLLFLLGGFIGGIFSVLFLEKSTRQALGLFLIARAIDSTYHSLVKKGYLPEFKYFYIFLYSISMIATGYCFTNQPGSLSPQTHNFYKSFTNQTIPQMQMRQITIQRKNLELAAKGIPSQDPLHHIPKLKVYYQKIRAAK